MNRVVGLFLFLMVGFVGCKQSEVAQLTKPDHKELKFLLDSLETNQFTFNTLSSKAEIELINEKKSSFKVHTRIKKDSLIWISITPLLGIEMARVQLTKDSVMFMNRVKSEYFIGDYAYINKMFNVELDFDMMQSLMIGNSLDFEKEGKIRKNIDRKTNRYYLGTQKRRKVRKDIKKDKEKLKETTQIIWLSPETFKVVELFVKDPEREQSLKGVFSDHKTVGENQLFPYDLAFTISAKKDYTINVNYSKVNLDKDLSFSFKIPSKYEQIQ